jgi:thiamine biosynthesis lipoprotein
MIYTKNFKAMGCHMFVALEYSSSRALKLLARVPEVFETWEATLSRFQANSELNRLNQLPGIAVPVSETLWSVFQASILAEARSHGLVTPTVMDALVAAGYDESFERLVRNQLASTMESPHPSMLKAIELQAKDHSICLPAGLRLDFGGIAKGWAAHQAMRRLSNYGPALVNAGGDIAISGLQHGGQPWLVGIEDPRRPEDSLGTLSLGRCGVATSGTDYRRWKQGGEWKHHIIDPRTGRPSQTDILSATVIAPTVLEAEMAAKTALILGSKDGMNWIESHAAYSGLLVTESNQMLYSQTFNAYLRD